MTTVDVTERPEATIIIHNDTVTEVIGVVSFQNISRGNIIWSTNELTDDNLGALVEPFDERVFSSAKTIYLKTTDKHFLSRVHIRSVSL